MPNPENQILLQDLPGAIQPYQKAEQISQTEVAFGDEDCSDIAMAKIATQNWTQSEAYMLSRGLTGQWNITETMLRAYVKPEKWKGSGDQYRSHLGIPIIQEQFYSWIAAIQQAIFSTMKPFQIDPAGDTSLDVAQAQEALLMDEMKSCGPHNGSLKREFRSLLYDGGLYGTGAAMYGWEIKRVKKIKHTQKHPTQVVGGERIPQGDPDELEEHVEWVETNKPVFEYIPLRRLRVAPDCRRSDIRTASWAGRIIYLDSYQLDDLRNSEGYADKIPTREQLIKLSTPEKLSGTEQNPLDYHGGSYPDFRQTNPQKAYPEWQVPMNQQDPLGQKYECIEYWTKDRVVRILEKVYVIYNEPHDFGVIPMLSFNFREAPESFFGWGLGQILGDFQKIATGVCNAFFDDWNLNLMGTYARPRGLNTSAQADFVFPGKIFAYDAPAQGSTGGGFSALSRNSVTLDPLTIVAQVRAWAASLTGIGATATGQNPGPTGNFRTGAGVNILAAGEAVKMSDMVDQLCDQVLTPWFEFCVEQNRKLKPSQIKSMLTSAQAKAVAADPISIIDGEYKVTITAGTRLAARQAADQRIGFIVQMLMQPGVTDQLEVQAKKVLYDNLLKIIFESTGSPYYESIVVDMTAEDKQRSLMKSQAAQQQGKLGQINAQTQGKIAVNENQSENRALLRAQERQYEEQDNQFEKQ